MRSAKEQPMKLYLGFDGAYVLSRCPLKVIDGDPPFLSSDKTAGCIDIQPREARGVLGHLKLKPFEVVEIAVGKKRKVTP